jgi:hypothetical protein
VLPVIVFAVVLGATIAVWREYIPSWLGHERPNLSSSRRIPAEGNQGIFQP